MREESKQREIEGVKKTLENPRLGFSQRASLEAYLKSLEAEK